MTQVRKVSFPITDDANDLSDEQISALLALAPAVNKWFDAVKGVAVARINAGGSVPGWAMGPGRRSRAWIDEAKAIEVMAAVGINDPYDRTLKSVAGAEKEIAKKFHPQLEAGWNWHAGTPALKQTAGGAALSTAFDPSAVDTYDPTKDEGFGW